MFARILVAIDLSETNKEIFSKALSLAKKTKANLMLLHVLSPEEESAPLPVPPETINYYPTAANQIALEAWQEQCQVLEKKGLELLESYAREAKEEGIEVTYRQIQDSVGKSICKLALDWQADSIVVGRRGRAGLSEMILGSVSNYVLHHAPCSVLIVQPLAVSE